MEDPGVPQRAPRRSGAADPASQRLQDLRADGPRTGRRRRRRRAARVSGLGPGRRLRRRPGHGVRPSCTTRCLARTTAFARSRRRPRAEALDRGPPWPAIILRTPKGWTGPDVVDGVQIQGTFRAHQVPLTGVRENPEHLRRLEAWLQSYHPHDLFDDDGRLAREIAELAPLGDKRMSASAVRERWPPARSLYLPAPGSVRARRRDPRRPSHENTEPLGELLRDVYSRDDPTRGRRRHLPAVLPGRDREQPARRRSSRSPIGACRPTCWPPTTTSHPTAG